MSQRLNDSSFPFGAVAMLIPCYNEEQTIGKVVDDFRRVLPGAAVWVGDRLSNGTYGEENKRQFHGFGSGLVRWLIHALYGFDYADVMTGYRALSRPFCRTYPVLSPGFELETELSIHAVGHRWRIEQVAIEYRDRPEGSESKLNTVSDGLKVLRMIASLFKDYRPLPFFLLLAVACLALGLPVVAEFGRTHLVERFPTAFLAMGLGILSALFVAVGLVLDTEVKASRHAWELECLRAFEEDRRLRARSRKLGVRADVAAG